MTKLLRTLAIIVMTIFVLGIAVAIIDENVKPKSDTEQFNKLEQQIESAIDSITKLRDSLEVFRTEYHIKFSNIEENIQVIRNKQKNISHEKHIKDIEIINSTDSADYEWFNNYFAE